MLILSRKVGESIVIGGTIEVTVVNVSNHAVKLGVKAPPATTVYRKEVEKQIGGEEPS